MDVWYLTTEQQIEKQVEDHVRSIENNFDKNLSSGDRIADKVATFGGSWKFIWWMISILSIWILWNALPFIGNHFDQFPFILLNLCLSFLAGFQAPFIMMSQNRISAKDRYYSEINFKNNYITRLEIQELHQPLLELAEKIKDITEMHVESQEQIALLRQLLIELHEKKNEEMSNVPVHHFEFKNEYAQRIVNKIVELLERTKPKSW